MKEWWNNLSTREQLILSSGFAFLIFLLFCLVIWFPLSHAITNKKDNVNYQRELLTWMQKAEAKIMRLRVTGTEVQTINEAQLLAVIDQSLKNNHLDHFIGGLQQTNNNQVLINAKQIPFDDLIIWLKMLLQQYHIVVTKITVAEDHKLSGSVNAEIVLGVSIIPNNQYLIVSHL